jgi:hypothetical protein
MLATHLDRFLYPPPILIPRPIRLYSSFKIYQKSLSRFVEDRDHYFGSPSESITY